MKDPLFTIPQSLLQGLLNYLGGQPYVHVNELIAGIQQLATPVTTEKNDEVHPERHDHQPQPDNHPRNEELPT